MPLNLTVKSRAMHRLRVAYVCNDISGLLHFREPVILAMRSLGVECWAIVPMRDGVFGSLRESLDRYRKAGVHICVWGINRSGVNPFREIASFLKLVKLYRKIKPNIVHHVTPKPVLYGGIAARFVPSVRAVNAISGLGYSFGKDSSGARTFVRFISSLMYKVALGSWRSYAIFQNPIDRDTLASQGSLLLERSELVHGSGVDPSFWKGEEGYSLGPIVIIACRMLKDKGVFEAIEAAKILKKRGVEIDLRFAGMPDAGNPNSITADQLNAWQKQGLITWLGAVRDMRSCFRSARIACLPSDYPEGVPRALIEAASCGLPLVSTSTPGCRDICVDGITGIQVPPRDPLELANALEKLLSNPSLCRTLGWNARQLVLQRFSINSVVAGHLRLYGRALRARPD